MTFVLFKKYDQVMYYTEWAQKPKGAGCMHGNKGRRVISYTVLFDERNVGHRM